MLMEMARFDFFDTVLLIAEFSPVILALSIVAATVAKKKYRCYVAMALPVALLSMILLTIAGSYRDAYAKGYDLSLPNKRDALEAYIETGEGPTAIEIIEGDTYAPTFGKFEFLYLVFDLVHHTLLHLDSHNGADVPIAYNKGNDWFRATLGEPMVYTSGIYKHGNESLWDAQHYKLDYVAHAIELKETDSVLDIGCGWGRLVHHFSTEYKAKVTGVTLSTEQKKFAEGKFDVNKGGKATILLQDAMALAERSDLAKYTNAKGKFDKITALEMAEHVGIRRYTGFLRMVHGLLDDDGVLYFQVAGLRREFQYEDLAWGLFMGEHVFPGADASCPLGWVSAKMEQAGFEIQRVSNLGTHYSRTLAQWLEEWNLDKDAMSKKYGADSWRRWEVFLAWSVRIARQGSSTVFMITATKAGVPASETTRVRSQNHLAPKGF
jgi:cyclopropane fatty-acyl-phospholipid synthase-like methyltransferase